MSSNVQTILDGLLEYQRNLKAPDLSQSAFFELFTTEQILKNYGLNYEEILSGIVDDRGGDGGIDAIYTFVNGVLATDDVDWENLRQTSLRQNAVITLIIIQSKTSGSFSDEAILRIEGTVNDLLNLSHRLENYSKIYNAQLLRAIEIFHRVCRTLLPTSPELNISFYYATTGDFVHPSVQKKAEDLKKAVKRLFTESKVEVYFYGAEKLLALHRKSKIETLPLNVLEALSTESMGTICLVRLKDYYNFIHDSDNGELRGWLFEENVRDYEGKNVDVNKGIRLTLESSKQDQDFWWLNNGITIVAAKAPMSGKMLTITDPKIVNGLQTSMEIYNYFRQHPEAEDNRNILVRAIVTTNEGTRNNIIKATNSQTAIKPASLRAFAPIHYKIEQYFAIHDLFYDRRKNFYKNQDKPKAKIISIQYLAQAVAAIVLQRPNDSRGRPTNLIKGNLHDRVFDDNYPIEVFLECVRFMKSIDEFLSSDNAPDYVKGHEVNVRYQLAMFTAAMKAKQLRVTPRYIQNNGLGQVSSEFLTNCLSHVWELLQAQRGPDKDIDEDRVSKSPDFDEKLKERIRGIIKTKEIPL